jgi:hypothetical protein
MTAEEIRELADWLDAFAAKAVHLASQARTLAHALEEEELAR